MEEVEIAVSIAEHGKEIGSLKHRMNEVEKIILSIHELALSVEKLASNINDMIKNQEKYETSLRDQGRRIGELEKADGEKWKSMVKTVLAVVVTGVIGFMMAKIGI